MMGFDLKLGTSTRCISNRLDTSNELDAHILILPGVNASNEI